VVRELHYQHEDFTGRTHQGGRQMSGKVGSRVSLAAAALLAAPALFAQQDAETFLAEAAQSDMAEVDVGKLAEQKAQDEDIREYGGMLVSEHQAHVAKVRDLATDLSVTLPTEPTAMQKQTYERLSRLTGAEFDREFIAQMVNNHRMAIEKYQVQTRSDDPDVATLAKDTLPALERHLAMAQTLQRGEAVTQRQDAGGRDQEAERERQGAEIEGSERRSSDR
jgi:putative membrane protein